MSVFLVFVRYPSRQFVLDFARRLAGGKAGAIRDSEDVRIHRDDRLAERCVEVDIRGLADDAR